MKNMLLVRVIYGRNDTQNNKKEYQLNGYGPVGTIEEFKRAYPNTKFEIKERPRT